MTWESERRVVKAKPLPLEERIRLALEHIESHGGGDQSLWPYQRFSMTVRELLMAARK